MSEAAAAQAEEVRRILLNKHLDIMMSNGPKRPGSAPPQAEVLPGSPMGPAPTGFNIITGEPLRGGVGGGPQQRASLSPAAQQKEAEELVLAADAEEALRSRPDYVSYYYANVRNNPRLPPPLTTRNISAPWVDRGKVATPEALAEAQGKAPDSSDVQAQATLNMLFGSQLDLKNGAEPIPIQGDHYLGQVRSADEQVLHESLYVGSTPHTPMGSQHGGPGQLFGSFNLDSPRAPSMDLVGRSMSSNSLGGAALGKDPKVSPAPGPTGRLASVIGDQRTSLRTPSKLRIGSSTLIDADSQQQLLTSLTSADTAAVATAAAAAAAAAAADHETAAAAAAAAAAAQQYASAAQVQAAVEAFQNLPPAAASAFAAALGGGDQASMAVSGQQLMSPDALLGGATGTQQQQMQAMYMAAAAMYPMYYAEQAHQAGMQSIQAMQAAAIASLPAISAAGAGFPLMPGGMPPAVLQSAYPPSVIPGLPPAAAASLLSASSVGTAGAIPDVAALAAAGLRSQQHFGTGLTQPYPGSGDYGAYYQKVIEAQAAAAAMAGGVVTKDADAVAAAALLRGGIPPPPPPPPGQPPPPPKDSKRNGGGEPHPGGSSSPYGHPLVSGDSERRLRTQHSGRDLGSRASGGLSVSISVNGGMQGSPGQVAGPQSPSQTHPGSFGNLPTPNSRLRAGSASQQGFLPHDNHLPSMGSGGLASVNSVGSTGPSYGREAIRAEGPTRRNSQRRGDLIAAVEAAEGHASIGGGQGGHGGGRGPRSSGDTLLDEFKTNKTGRKYELREILGHVYEFSLDQHGSRFIQQKLEGANLEDLDAAFSEVLPRILHLMTDVFGNYVVQKFLEHGTLEHRARLAKALHGHVLQLSLQMYGCRVVQKALEVFSEEQQVELVAELDGHIMRCVRDQNGNHVIQKCIECVPTARITGLLDSFLMCVVPLSTHPFGCRIIQRILEHVRDQRRRAAVMADILSAAVQLTQDQYGNYVIQHVLERGTAEERSSIAGSLAATVVQLSMHKFASNVIEKCLTYGSTADRDLLINRMLGAQALQMQQAAASGTMDGDMEVEAMMKDQFGNYVVQKVLEVCTDDQRETMLARVRQQLHALKRFTYGKHIVARVEKLLSAGTRYQTHAKGRLLPDDEALAAAAAAAGARLGALTTPAPPPPPASATAAFDVLSSAAAGEGSGVSAAFVAGEGSDGGSNSQPPAPTTPPVSSAGAGEAVYTSSTSPMAQAASVSSSDGGAVATDRPCSGLVGLEVKDDSPEAPAVAEVL